MEGRKVAANAELDAAENRVGHHGEYNLCEKNIRGYCNASINRVMVRFRSLSDRRISSILWIECSTVVWCLPPN
jgi:hypothetical protein